MKITIGSLTPSIQSQRIRVCTVRTAEHTLYIHYTYTVHIHCTYTLYTYTVHIHYTPYTIPSWYTTTNAMARPEVGRPRCLTCSTAAIAMGVAMAGVLPSSPPPPPASSESTSSIASRHTPRCFLVSGIRTVRPAFDGLARVAAMTLAAALE